MIVQFKKGVLDLCVLALLLNKDCYGYEINEYMANHIEIADGTIYPILRKLNKEGYLSTYLQESNSGAPRKYYSITSKGKEFYKTNKREWLSFIKQVKEIMKEGEKHDE
ncbi:PadR family transcriptional regulator [Clostridium niameyense]|uniref:PadR family transcriptional regulator n=1 Tax=Clostridium niameyense TaxID=1622073 RepID=A0A6M0RDE2_9CLOT|nr:PadR family transcriptional regulator [Clostridium niameyense]NEZ47308.1 PadR family transcriptional regulator [Clostridium niameyense]